MASHAELAPATGETRPYTYSFRELGRKALGSVEDYFKAGIPAIERLDLTRNVRISIPHESFHLTNAKIHPQQLIFDGLRGVATKEIIVPKNPALGEAV